jgi:hypothetical protein
MKCTEIRRSLKNKYRNADAIPEELMAHIEHCELCHEAVALERLTAALLKAYASSEAEKEETASPYLMSRIKALIRELSDQGVGSWESAVVALRGWIIAFGAVAILLLTVSSYHGKLSNPPGIDLVEDPTSMTNYSDDLISSNVR